MPENTFSDALLEQQQHDAVGRVSYRFELERRDFFKLLGGGVLICLCAKSTLAQESGSGRARNWDDELPGSIDAWLHIAEDGTVTVYTGKVEMGQNIRTSLSQQVAEELHAPLSAIRMVMGDTDFTPYDAGTFGSRTTPVMGTQLRKVAASARSVLIAMAAESWQVDLSGLTAADGKITDPKNKKSISYGELTKGQKVVKVIGDHPPVTSPEKWTLAGTSPTKVDGRAFVTGQHKYTSDMTLPGMLHGKVLRPSAFQASLTSLDTSAAERISGVTVVHDGDFIGVAAVDQSTASRAIAAMQAQWKAPTQPSDANLFEYLKTHPQEAEGFGGRSHDSAGSTASAIASADHTLQQKYTVAYIAHAPLEPRAALAEWTDGKLTVWTGTQRPFGVHEELTKAFRLPNDKVRVIVPDTGSAYGGKHTGEVAIEAARLAKAAGKPVKVVWNREEEFTWAYFRPAGVIEIKSGIRNDGTITAWEFDNYNSGPSGIATPYNIANRRVEFHPSDSPLRQGSYRGLAATANHFAREMHVDELAHVLGMDPLQFRLKNLSNSRLRAVLETAAAKFGWEGKKSSSTRGFGIACGMEKGGYVASCVEVEVDRSTVKIRRVMTAFECGAVVNPNGLKNQIEGAVVQGIGGALFEAIQFENGRILNPHFAEYRVPRFSDVPDIEVVLVDRKDLPSAGAGETPLIALAPAVGNAIFNATGIWLRSLPMVPNGLPQQNS
jgi:isoquinoline 1-oxidoreductase